MVISDFKKVNPELEEILNVTSSKNDKSDDMEALNETILHSA